MTRGILTISTFVSVIFFPWPLTALLAIAASFFEPLIPFAAGLFADTLYYSPVVHLVPTFTLWGAFASLVALFVRKWFSASIM